MKQPCTYEMKVEDKYGYLVYSERTHRFHPLSRYDVWRSGICHKYRHDNRLWLRFRQGKLDPITLAYALTIRFFWR